MRTRFLLPFALVLLAASAARFAFAAPPGAADDSKYRKPPAVIADLLTAPRVPRGAPNSSPDGAWLAVPDLRSLIPIGTLAEPVAKLAGLEVLPGMWAHRNGLKNAASGLSFYRVSDGAQVRAKLPADVRLGTVRWSQQGDRVACAAFANGGDELWIVEAATGAAHRVPGVRLQNVSGVLEWSNDGKGVFVSLVPDGAGIPAEEARVPEGPSIRRGAGRATAQRTARDVLKAPEEQARFVATVTTQLALVAVGVGGDAGAGTVRKLGGPVAFAAWGLAPDESHLVVHRYVEPVPLGFPSYLFPRRVELWPLSAAGAGAPIALGDVPLNDRSAVASVSPLGPRNLTWAPDSRSLWFSLWEDTPGASAQAAVRDTSLAPPGRDRIMRLDAPFTGAAVEVARAQLPLQGMAFTSDGAKLLLHESYRPRRAVRQAWLDARDPARGRTLVLRSSEGAYDDPGEVALRSEGHTQVAWVSPDGKHCYRFGEGHRAGGQRPFLDRCAFDGGKPTRLFESEAARLETPVRLLGADAKRFLTLRQTASEPPNWFLRRAGQARPAAITAFTNPAEALSRAQRQQFTFQRDDGVALNAEVVLPADWRPGSAPLPTVFWIYPNDFRSAQAASEDRTSPNRFPSQSPLNPEVLVTQGYAVVRPDLAIVGTNDQYVAELQRSARAAVDECVKRGFTDRGRIGVGGHSYGAFSTVNCLAHTRLFRAGVASDGAYNRTLTPFTFQAETRNLWEARDTYLGMSPFLYADRIEAPLLLLHNLDDTNVGTHPMQSQRLFEALNGLGKTVQLVEYPYEDHGPAARETVLDYWARALEWYDRHVRNAQPPAAATPQAP
jgi:dipeptidyl aminopeptidase/acylaminoacyl peptidase